MAQPRKCIDCGADLAGHGKPSRCRSCAARTRYIDLHGKPADIVTANCAVCEKEFRDYASNRRKGEVTTCSPECRAAWAGVVNSIRRGGDGRKRTKAEKDHLYYLKCSDTLRQRAKDYYHSNKATILSKKQEADRELKVEVMAAYGGKCECCGEAHIEFLTIDHINGDGAQHRAACGKGRKVYADIKRQGFPKGKYRCLCLNCNIALGFYGYCPHKPHTKSMVDHTPKNPGRKRTVR